MFKLFTENTTEITDFFKHLWIYSSTAYQYGSQISPGVAVQDQ